MSSSKKALIISNIWTFTIGGALLIYGLIMIYYKYVRDINLIGTIGLPIAGAIMVVAGIANVLAYRNNREKVLGALQSYERVQLSQLSSELKISESKTKDIIVDLRSEGKLKASFEPETGDVLVIEVKGEPPIAVVPMSSSGLPEHEEKFKDKRIPKDHNYCSYCGSIVKPEDQFCNNCGSYLS
jgi:hypothetical protein